MISADRSVKPASGWARLALLHPVWLLLMTLIVLMMPLFAMSMRPTGLALASTGTLASLWIILGWSYGIYGLARAAGARRQLDCGPERGWIFGLSAVAVAVLPVALLNLPPVLDEALNLVGGLGAAFFFVSLWLAATALVTAEGHPIRYPTNRAVGAFLLMAYWVIGAWFLRPRLLALRDAALGSPVRVD